MRRMKFGTRKMLTFGGQRVILMLPSKLIIAPPASTAARYAFFVRSFGCAFFIFRSLRVLFVIVLRAIQDGAKTV